MKDTPLISFALQKIAYGHTPQTLEEIKKKGFEKYLLEQLNPKDADDALYFQKKKATKIHVKYDKTDEQRPFTYLNQTAKQLFGKLNQKGVSHQEKQIPAREVWADTWLRAVYSKWQLREMLVEFWHNHFNVSINAHTGIAISLPLYDATIRQHCLGNFRQLLEAVAKSPAMLYYLDNYNSKASPANENYARELFELHTLGAGNYLNHLYNRWKEVPNALKGNPVGYIDEDVYEAARAFTGWTVADGSRNEKGGEFENTGEFLYYEGWHDNYQKRVLGVEFSPNQAPMADGLKVLDLVAYHQGTAKFICTKICKRFVADNPPDSLVQKAVEVWLKHQKSNDQIEQVLQAILLSDEFKNSYGKKYKRPFEYLVSLMRSLQMDFTPNNTWLWLVNNTGYTHFTWDTPTGHPDEADYWHSSNFLLNKWNVAVTLLTEDWHKITEIDIEKQTPEKYKTAQEMAIYWLDRLLPEAYNDELKRKACNFLAAGGDIDAEPFFYDDREKKYRFSNLIALILMSPAYQLR